MTRSTWFSFLLFGVAIGLAGALACSDRQDETACYERDSTLDWDGPIELRPMQFCEWGPGRRDYPDPPGEYANTWTISVTFEPTTGMPCDPCDLERFDALLKAEIEMHCDGVYELVRGCYVPVEETSFNKCVVEGLYHSNCDAPTEG